MATTVKDAQKKRAIKDIICDPKRVDAELQQFSQDAKVGATQQSALLKKYPRRWVAIYNGDVQADGGSLKQILSKINALGLPRERVVIRYMDSKPRRMIL